MNLEDEMLSRILFIALLGLGPVTDAPAAAPPAAVTVVVEDGFHPDRIVVKAGQPLRLTFLRREHTGCTLEVVFPTLGITRTLPPGEPVTIDLGTPTAGEIPFRCGMGMIHGAVIVTPTEPARD